VPALLERLDRLNAMIDDENDFHQQQLQRKRDKVRGALDTHIDATHSRRHASMASTPLIQSQARGLGAGP
jgi:hypothetical protein